MRRGARVLFTLTLHARVVVHRHQNGPVARIPRTCKDPVTALGECEHGEESQCGKEPKHSGRHRESV
jgi:hypothetical protein